MRARHDRCQCAECRALDRLPRRKQGLPGAVQVPLPLPRVDTLPAGAGITAGLV